MSDIDTERVASPQIVLYAFQLSNNLVKGEEEIVKGADNLWLKCQEVGTIIDVEELRKLPESIANNNKVGGNGELIPEAIRFYKEPQSKNQNLNLEGAILPRKIHDTYALDLTLGYPGQEVKLSELHKLNINNCLLPTNINASIGQTLVLFVKPLKEFQKEEFLEKFASDCVKALITPDKFNELGISCKGKGIFLGSPIFEYNNNAVSPKEQCHIMIWLSTNPETDDKEASGKYYEYLVDLLLCRSKIIYVNYQAIWCNQQARKKYSRLENTIGEFNQIKSSIKNNLGILQQWLIDVPEMALDYAIYIRDLKTHITTIRTNIENYRLDLDAIEQLCEQDDLKFFSNFLGLAQRFYVQQIGINLEYLSSGNELFKQMVETIRGLVEIEEAKREQSLERTVQVVGVALGGGAMVSGVVAEHVKEPFVWTPNFKYPLHPITNSLFWSFVATLFFGLLALWWTKLSRKGSNS